MKFSKLASLGDLSQYSLNDLKRHLKNWNFKSSSEGDIIITEWCNNSTSITVLYTLEGEFIQILEEHWLGFSEEIVFKRGRK
jgi:hypothetical protein